MNKNQIVLFTFMVFSFPLLASSQIKECTVMKYAYNSSEPLLVDRFKIEAPQVEPEILLYRSYPDEGFKVVCTGGIELTRCALSPLGSESLIPFSTAYFDSKNLKFLLTAFVEPFAYSVMCGFEADKLEASFLRELFHQ